jgi:eukaryotic-like serine/threonine-protein kinase
MSDPNAQLVCFVRRDAERLPAGRLLHDRYIVVRRVATTGLSTVYQGVDRQTGQAVAIKRLSSAARPGGLPRASAVRGFFSEAALLRGLQHPQLPRLCAAFQEHDDCYLVTDYVAGCSLDQLLAEGSVTPELAWRVAASLCDAVAALHGQEPPLIHADIKPNNVIVGPHGRVTLLDLGLARRRGDEPLAEVMGTPPYTPPEQWAGRPIDERADIYALGKLLEELFEAAGVRSMRRMLARSTAPAPAERLGSVGRLRCALDVARTLEAERARQQPWLIVDGWTILGWLAILMVIGIAFLH